MKVHEIKAKIKAEHGIVASFPGDFFGYFGWPSITRMSDGTLVVAASGLRNAHVCPFGKTILCMSTDNGESWTPPAVVNDFPVDDRDAGVCSPAPDTIVVSWFSSDTRVSAAMNNMDEWEDTDKARLYRDGLSRITDTTAESRTGYWVRVSRNRGESWDQPIRVALTAPHGPIALPDGKLFYFGKGIPGDLGDTTRHIQGIASMVSDDTGQTWSSLGTVPLADGTDETNYYESHVVHIADNHFLGLIRVQDGPEKGRLESLGEVPFSIAQTVTRDGGKTWSQAELLGFHGSPPHVFRHTSGALVCVYGYRKEPYGEQVMLSYDNGESWDYHYVLRDDGPDTDLGYPASVELSDGSIFTVYYQKIAGSGEKCSLLWSRWKLP